MDVATSDNDRSSIAAKKGSAWLKQPVDKTSKAVRGGSPLRQTLDVPLRVGIVGAGKMATNHALAIGRCTTAGGVMAIADPTENALRSLSKIVPGAKRFGNLTDLLAGAEIDVIHICTPPSSHAALATEALEAGCHVYVEKPFAESVAEADQILRLARQRGLAVAAGHQLLYERPTRVAAKLMSALGRVTHIESYFSFRAVRRAPGGRVPLASDLQLLDILPHPVYLLLHFLDLGNSGFPELVALDVGERGTLHALIRQGQITASLVVTLEGRPVESYVRIVGTNGSLFADYVRGTVQRQLGPGTSGIDKILAPYRLAGQLIRGTTSAIAARLLDRQRSYPGLVEAFDSFYRAIRNGEVSPITEQNIIDTSRLWEKVAVALRSTQRAHSTENHCAAPGGVLLTGGTGLLGQAVARELAVAGRRVRVVSRRQPARWERVPGVEYVTADLAKPLTSALFEGIDAVIHAAAETAGGWEQHQQNSIDATNNVVRAAAAAGVRRLVHVSSLAVLSRPTFGRPVTDDTPLEPQSREHGPYVWGKVESERLAAKLGRELKIDVKIARPGPLVDFGNFDPPGRLGRRVGNFLVAVGMPGDPLAMTDVGFAARTIIWMLNGSDAVPDTINVLNPDLPTRRDAVKLVRRMNPDLTVIWLPMALLVPLAWVAVIAQKVLHPRRPAMNLAKAFASPRYDTARIAYVAARMAGEDSVDAPGLPRGGTNRELLSPILG
jgi:predicted dehydrogenase/nucleoside-diphosphate-sugar epimerase